MAQIFSTDHGNPNDDQQDPINLTSSYVDLSIVYGNNQKEQDSIRLRDGTGKIYNDTFADGRLLHMPPSSPALLVLFSRNHNYICETILEINERGWWSNPPPTDEAKRAQQDEDIFQTARLINCGSVMSVVLSDYLAGILGTVREGNSWSLDLQTLVRNEDHSIAPRGAGNVVSAEFAALYHFHATISKDDEKWVENMFRDPKMFGDTPWDKITVPQYKAKIQEIKAASEAHKDKPYTWTFGGLKRDPVTHKFNDADLARIILDATERPASAFKARGSPHAMKIIELMAIEQNRAWGLKPFSTFEEWNPRHDVADAARRLYGHPDNLELYVGLQAEESKPVMPGAGLCCGYTATRAILADAVALVRGDRFLTNDLTAFNLTAWGLKDATRNPDNSSNGGFLPKLFMRALPDYFPHWVAVEDGDPYARDVLRGGVVLSASLYSPRVIDLVTSFVFLDDIDPSTKVAREPQVKQTIDNLALLTRQHFARVKDWLVPGVGLVDTAIHLLLAQNATSHEWLRRLRHSTRKPDGELTNSIVALALFLSIEFGQALTNVIDVLLPPSPEPISPKLLRALQSSDETATNVLRGMIVDALKTRPVIPGVSRMAETDVPVPGGMVKRGDRVYVCLADAMTEMQKGEGKTIRGRHELLGDGLSRILGQDLLVTLLVPVVRTLLSLKDVIRAPGNSGRLEYVVHLPNLLHLTSLSWDDSYFEHMIGGTETIGEDGKPVDGSAYRVKAFLDRRVYTIGPWASSLVVKYTE
ncbi:hypothetical protein FRB99_004516 [Tulasnella sp. 403]|nr:hypothetical protein FRB99_004516 [Tulasnella sp. 403]